MAVRHIHLTEEEAARQLQDLEASVEGGIEEFEARVYTYSLSPKEAGVWDRIETLRWLLGIE